VALAALKGEKTLSELAEQFDVHANRAPVMRSCMTGWKQITQWKGQLLEGAAGVFGEAIGHYLEFYSSIRPHSSLGALTHDQVYFNRLPESMAA
jgi:hypothetical protein